LEFWDHVDWSDEKIEQNLKKVFDYLKKHKIEYGEDPLDSHSILIEMSKAEFLEFCSFITEKLRAPPNCIHVPYQVLCVNGDGNFEVIYSPPEEMNIDDFVYYIWRKHVKFPKIDFPSS
jgi:hypothetical protein